MLNRNFRQLTDLCNYINIHISHIFERELGSEWHFSDYCHNFNRVYIVTEGEGVLFSDTEHILMQPSNMYVIPANHTYSCRCDDYMKKFFIHFTAVILPQKDLLSDVGRIVTIPLSEDEIKRFNDMLHGESISSALMLRNHISALILRLIETDSEAIERDVALYRKYEKLFKYIEDNLYADLSVAAVCSYIGFSQTYIGQRFKADTGATIKQYITGAMVERLKYMLLSTSLSVGSIAAELRFDSESYCSKFFKKHTGITPSDYRKIHMMSA